MAVSPYGKVPVLAIDGVSIYESAIINEYLEETYPDKPLMPDDAYDRAQVRIWTDYAASRFVKPLYAVYRSKDPEKKSESLVELNKELAYLENHLNATSGDWFIGDMFTLADINMLPFVFGASRMEEKVLSKFPAIESWLDAFQERNSFKETLTTD